MIEIDRNWFVVKPSLLIHRDAKVEDKSTSWIASFVQEQKVLITLAMTNHNWVCFEIIYSMMVMSTKHWVVPSFAVSVVFVRVCTVCARSTYLTRIANTCWHDQLDCAATECAWFWCQLEDDRRKSICFVTHTHYHQHPPHQHRRPWRLRVFYSPNMLEVLITEFTELINRSLISACAGVSGVIHSEERRMTRQPEGFQICLVCY